MMAPSRNGDDLFILTPVPAFVQAWRRACDGDRARRENPFASRCTISHHAGAVAAMSAHQYVLTLSCPDRPGIVSAVSTFLAHNGQNILDAHQSSEGEAEKAFIGVGVNAAVLAVERPALQPGVAAILGRC